MKCFVYKGDRKSDHYLYLPNEIENLNQGLPEALINMLGELSFILEFDLAADRKLPQADAQQVLNDLQDQGFYLQLPKKDMIAEENELFN